jgi:hypothetical protein
MSLIAWLVQLTSKIQTDLGTWSFRGPAPKVDTQVRQGLVKLRNASQVTELDPTTLVAESVPDQVVMVGLGGWLALDFYRQIIGYYMSQSTGVAYHIEELPGCGVLADIRVAGPEIQDRRLTVNDQRHNYLHTLFGNLDDKSRSHSRSRVGAIHMPHVQALLSYITRIIREFPAPKTTDASEPRLLNPASWTKCRDLHPHYHKLQAQLEGMLLSTRMGWGDIIILPGLVPQLLVIGVLQDPTSSGCTPQVLCRVKLEMKPASSNTGPLIRLSKVNPSINLLGLEAICNDLMNDWYRDMLRADPFMETQASITQTWESLWYLNRMLDVFNIIDPEVQRQLRGNILPRSDQMISLYRVPRSITKYAPVHLQNRLKHAFQSTEFAALNPDDRKAVLEWMRHTWVIRDRDNHYSPLTLGFEALVFDPVIFGNLA